LPAAGGTGGYDFKPMKYTRRVATIMVLLFGARLCPAVDVRGETITVATYNVENFERHFEARR
jgi:hypothetical protein